MKKLISLLFLSIMILSLDAQNTQAKQKFYAIDGSEWITKYDRDRKERLVWDKIELNLKSALVKGRFGEANAKEYHDTFQRLFKICRESFERLRVADAGKEILQNPEFRFFLSENGVKVRTGQARNGEAFNFEEYSNCFDSVLREYNFNSELIDEMSNKDGQVYNLDFVVSDFIERMELVTDKIEREILATEFKERMVLQLVPQYEAAKRAAKTPKKKQNRR